MAKRTRTQIAEEIAIATLVFVRQARREGHSNKITDRQLAEVAESRNYFDHQYSLRTVKKIVRDRARLMNEMDLIALD